MFLLKGYIIKILSKKLLDQGIQLITTIRKKHEEKIDVFMVYIFTQETIYYKNS